MYAAAGVDIPRPRRTSAHRPACALTHGPGAGRLWRVRRAVSPAPTSTIRSWSPAPTASAPRCCSGSSCRRYDVLGRDLVNLSVNDVLTTGARPLFFLDYVGLHALDQCGDGSARGGMAAACRENGCALLGGETAQMPELYAPGHFDLAGTVVGVVERAQVMDGSRRRSRATRSGACRRPGCTPTATPWRDGSSAGLTCAPTRAGWASRSARRCWRRTRATSQALQPPSLQAS